MKRNIANNMTYFFLCICRGQYAVDSIGADTIILWNFYIVWFVSFVLYLRSCIEMHALYFEFIDWIDFVFDERAELWD